MNPFQWVQDTRRGVLTHVQRSPQPRYGIYPFQWVQDDRRGVLTHVQRSLYPLAYGKPISESVKNLVLRVPAGRYFRWQMESNFISESQRDGISPELYC